MDITATTILDSISDQGVRIFTVEAYHPRFILAEVNTHRVLTRNGASSRAIPFHRIAEAIRSGYARPLQWLKNQPGMVATEIMDAATAAECDAIWLDAMDDALHHAQKLAERGAAKQYVNRLVEPFLMTRTLITSTQWANFFKLRIDPTAQPEFRELAQKIAEAMVHSRPVRRSAFDRHDADRWHLPYIRESDQNPIKLAAMLEQIPGDIKEGFEAGVPYFEEQVVPLFLMSIARSARLSYNLFDGEEPSFERDLSTFKKLWTDPLHASPMEHQALPIVHPAAPAEIDGPRLEQTLFGGVRTGNFTGWRQLRKYLPNEAAIDSQLEAA